MHIKLFINILLTLSVVLFTLIGLELFTRMKNLGVFDLSNRFLNQKNLLTSAYPGVLHPELGWIPKPNTIGNENIWGTKITISKDGIRLNGKNKYNKKKPVILAVGDSFTFGDQVSDKETWPSYLEEYSKSKVINGGVFNYGVDQILLRTQVLVKKFRPEVIIFSFIPRDIDRNGQSMRAKLSKPYFKINNGKLELHNSHIDISNDKITYKIDFFKKYLGHSFLVNELMMKYNPKYWLIGNNYDWNIDNKPVEISCLIMKQFKKLLIKNNIKGFVLVQYNHLNYFDDRLKKNMKKVLKCIDEVKLKKLDLLQRLKQLRTKNNVKYESLFNGHMTSKGNSYLAKELNEFLKNNGYL